MFKFASETEPGSVRMAHGVVSSRTRRYANKGDTHRDVERNALSRKERASLLKMLFHEVDCAPVRPAPNHTHGESAAARSTASRMIDSICLAAGARAVFYQGSSADLRNGRVVTRRYHWAKDVYVPLMDTDWQENDVLALVDVDYYVDMPAFLAEHHQPVLLYTTTPSSAGADRGEYKYRFAEDGTLDYLVSGGGHYTHQLWDWSGDALSVKTTLLGGWVTYGYYTYAIERRSIDEDHSLILLVPLNIFEGFSSWWKDEVIAAKPLVRFNPVQDEFVRLLVNQPDGLRISTARVGQYLSATVPVVVDDQIHNNAVTRRGELTLASVKMAMGSDPKKHLGAEVLWSYHKVHTSGYGQIIDLASGVRRYQWVARDGTFDEDAKPAMVAFMHPLVDKGFVADNTKGNEQRAISQRIELHRRPKQTHMSYFLSQCMDEFICMLVPDPHKLNPVDEDEVSARQPRPSQQRQIENQEEYELGGHATVFLKRQADQKVTNPRPITQMNAKDKLSLAPFIYALDDVLHAAPWWMPGKKPDEQAARVVHICTTAKLGVDQADCKALDSTLGYVPEELNRRFLAYAFHPRHHMQLYAALKANLNKTALARWGETFESWLQTCSGSMMTTDRNTLCVGFASYYALRLMGYGPREAYRRMGAVNGDDTLQGDVDGKILEKAYGALGLILKSQFVARGCFGVEFLARRYGPDVWYGDPNSTCDIKRQASKFHLCVCLPSNITKEQKLVDKAYSFWLSDARTPIIGDLVCRVKQLFPELWPRDPNTWSNVTRQYTTSVELSHQYPNEVGLFGMDVLEQQLPEFGYGQFLDQLKDATRDTIFEMDICDGGRHDPDPEPGQVVVDGDLLGVPAPEPAKCTEKLQLPDRITDPLVHVDPKPKSGSRKKYRERKPRSQREQATSRKAGLKKKQKSKSA